MTTGPIIHHAFNIPLRIGTFTWLITGFGIAVFVAFLIAQVISERVLRARGHDTEAGAVGDVLIGAIVGTIIGGKLYYINVISHDWNDFFTRAGFVFWGGFMGAVVVCFLIIRYKKLSFARFADVAGIAIAGAYSVGRTACWAVGDDYGMWYTGPLAVAFPEGIPATTVRNMTTLFKVNDFPAGMDPNTVVSVIPTQLIEVALGFAMFLLVWRLRHHKHAEGWLMGVYCVLAGVERFAVEFLRAKDDRFFTVVPLSAAQLIAVGIFIVGVIIMRVRDDGSKGPIVSGPAVSGLAHT